MPFFLDPIKIVFPDEIVSIDCLSFLLLRPPLSSIFSVALALSTSDAPRSCLRVRDT